MSLSSVDGTTKTPASTGILQHYMSLPSRAIVCYEGRVEKLLFAISTGCQALNMTETTTRKEVVVYAVSLLLKAVVLVAAWPPKDARTIPEHIEVKRFAETKVTGYRLKQAE